MGRKFTSATTSGGRVTLWEEGADSMSDYFPAMHDLSQRFALEMILEHGTVDGFYVETTNSRHFDEPDGKEERSARRFANLAGRRYLEKVFFPARATRLEAVADAALVPGAVVIAAGEEWVDGHPNRIQAYRGSTSSGEAGYRQIVAHPWIEVAS